MPYKDPEQHKRKCHEYYLAHREKMKQDAKEYRATHKDDIARYNKEYAEKHHDEILEYHRKYHKEHREDIIKYLRDWRKNNPDKVKEDNKKYRVLRKTEDKVYKQRRNETHWGNAGRQLHEAIRLGKIKKQPCEVCGAEPADAHHCDYNKPLDVMWLCRKHHAEWHTNNKPIYKKGV